MIGFFSWLGASMAAAISSAVVPILHERIQADRLSTMFWLRVVVLFVAAPALLFVGLPDNPTFYAATFVTAFIWIFADLSSIRASEEFGAAEVNRLIPLNVLVTYFMWLAVDSQAIEAVFSEPLRAFLIFISMGLAVFFTMRLQPGPITRDHLRAMGPVILLSGVGVVFAKIAVDSSDLHDAVFGYITVQAVLMIAIFAAIEAIWHPVPRAVFAGRVAMASGILTGLGTAVHMVFKSYGYALVENPAYVSVVVLTTPIWIMLYFRLARGMVLGDLRMAFMAAVSVLAMALCVSL